MEHCGVDFLRVEPNVAVAAAGGGDLSQKFFKY